MASKPIPLVWPDGRIFAHNITPELAALLAQLDPDDPAMRARAQSQEAPLAPPVLATGPRATGSSKGGKP